MKTTDDLLKYYEDVLDDIPEHFKKRTAEWLSYFAKKDEKELQVPAHHFFGSILYVGKKAPEDFNIDDDYQDKFTSFYFVAQIVKNNLPHAKLDVEAELYSWFCDNYIESKKKV